MCVCSDLAPSRSFLVLQQPPLARRPVPFFVRSSFVRSLPFQPFSTLTLQHTSSSYTHVLFQGTLSISHYCFLQLTTTTSRSSILSFLCGSRLPRSLNTSRWYLFTSRSSSLPKFYSLRILSHFASFSSARTQRL